MIRIRFQQRLHHHAVDLQVVRGLVVCEDLSVAVHDQTPFGRDLDLSQCVRLGQAAVFLRLHALYEPERAGQKHEHRHDAPQHGIDAELQKLLIVTIDAHGFSLPGRGTARGFDRLFT
jgi:hypothetical protein